MKALYISGSPRENSNTDPLLRNISSVIDGEGEFIKLSDHDIQHCKSCWVCRDQDGCVIDDDMINIIIPKLLQSDVLVLGSPVYFNNVSSYLKMFMDRTWSIRGKLKDKIGGTIVVGRRYGHESAITAINSFFLKHEIIISHRGISGIAFEEGAITQDEESLKAIERLGKRINELDSSFKYPDE